jgi:Ca2+-transporting ATPase
VATISLARGMIRLSKHQVVVKKLAAVETLGETNVIFTDKTGTLTENKLKLNTICLPGDQILHFKPEDSKITLQVELEKITNRKHLDRLFQVAVLCNNANYSKQSIVGDPLEVALLEFVAGYSEHQATACNRNFKRIQEEPFNSESKIMATLHENNERYFVSAKGATEELLTRCSFIMDEDKTSQLTHQHHDYWIHKTNEIASKGLKVLAFAYQELENKSDKWTSALTFIGLVAFSDPPRPDVPEAIKSCLQSGIKVIMVTGDHQETAKTIALQIGLVNDASAMVLNGNSIRPLKDLNDNDKTELERILIFSRVTPIQKLELIQLYKDKGDIVAMTGDGVNDAPALKKADIGIAMGVKGTEVAREAADMILQDDAFPSIVRAIRQGRIIFKNIKNFIIYLLSCNLGEIMIVSIASIGSFALPLQPLQILFLNLVTDVFPALAIGMGKGNPSIMDEQPRDPKEPLISTKGWISIIVYSSILTISVLSVFMYSVFYKGYSDEICNNISFLTLAFAQLLHPISLIGAKESLIKNDIIRNPYIWWAVVLCVSIILAVFYIPYTKEVLNLNVLGLEAWISIGIGSVVPILIIRIIKKAGWVE